MTKNIILGAVAALVLGPTAAAAADLPVKAPVPIAIYDWTGFYIGVSGGGSFGQSTHIDQATGLGDTIGYNVKGGLVGGTLGYNWQVSRFVVGFEGDASWVGQYGSNVDDGLAGNPAFTSFTKETWVATARGRLGYAVNNLLFYGTMPRQALKPASRTLTPALSSLQRHQPAVAGRQAAALNGDLRPTGRPSSSGST
jgi:outer membrane immunogenic protein